ncbi:hypothetical protein LSAT2_017845 [Lamellibrachia satsuma]|nr:hypothetical protein LSAT2_017845 [Lamellibrachia satsuma]
MKSALLCARGWSRHVEQFNPGNETRPRRSAVPFRQPQANFGCTTVGVASQGGLCGRGRAAKRDVLSAETDLAASPGYHYTQPARISSLQRLTDTHGMDSRIQNTSPQNTTQATTTTPAAASGSGSNNGNSSFYRTEEARVTDNGQWCITVCPTIGGHFQLQVSAQDTVDGLMKAIGKRLKIQREKISLLYRERLLTEGTLSENGIHEGCKITLLPNVESGLVPPKPEHTVLQALENLSDSQVNAFLAGRSPLTLAMRLGEHMMFVQLQLSTSPPSLKHSQPPHRCLRKSASHPQHVPSTIQPSSNVHRHSTAHGAFSRTAPAADPSRVADDGRASGPRNGGATLSEAKQNLSQKLKEFSQVAKTQGDETVETPVAQRPSSSSSSSSSSTSSSSSSSTSSSSSPYSSHAIIESMEQVGQGVYSGTFSASVERFFEHVLSRGACISPASAPTQQRPTDMYDSTRDSDQDIPRGGEIDRDRAARPRRSYMGLAGENLPYTTHGGRRLPLLLRVEAARCRLRSEKQKRLVKKNASTYVDTE